MVSEFDLDINNNVSVLNCEHFIVIKLKYEEGMLIGLANITFISLYNLKYNRKIYISVKYALCLISIYL